ncbi:hypothetical protein NDU88_004021 [Pleurodeles waltl]|uniref:Uncharacterized protein n=1 Tax=Pleurodeles waltl TaxID=8319 RepID=A0AAV7KWK9_PLEWA|nr:hypothetical protein NDU88_004021 [Pleurodeles waltl]
MKVVKVLNGAVQLEDGRVRNLRHVSLFKASSLSQESVCDDLDEESGYLWGYEDARSDRGEGGGESRGGESRNREDDMIPIRKSQRERKLPRHFNEFRGRCVVRRLNVEGDPHSIYETGGLGGGSWQMERFRHCSCNVPA